MAGTDWRLPRIRLRVLALLLVALIGCGGEPDVPSTATSSPAAPGPVASVSSADDDQASTPTVVFLGDSLTAGFGLSAGRAFPALIELALRQDGQVVKVVNAGVSGDTTAGGLRRLDWLLRQVPDVLVVALGANDGLRGVDLESTASNLRTIITRAQAAGARVILAGMLIPPNYGPAYTEGFAAIFPTLAEELDATLIPFLLEGVAADPELNQADGIHPNAEGQRRIATLVRPYIEAALAEVGGAE